MNNRLRREGDLSVAKGLEQGMGPALDIGYFGFLEILWKSWVRIGIEYLRPG